METALKYERTLQLFRGKSGDQAAGEFQNPTYRRAALQKLLKVMLRDVNDLDTTTRHREILMVELEGLERDLRGLEKPTWDLVLRLFALVGRLLGCDGISGCMCYTPFYCQTQAQAEASHILEGERPNWAETRQNAIAKRRRIVQDLKEEGDTDFQVALVLNTSEYEIKKLKKGL